MNPSTFVSDRSSSAVGQSAVSWSAILAGAAAAAALSLVLLLLGAGLGLTVVSPWASQGAGVAAVGVSAVVWIAFTQLAASGLGGYLAGRLRTRWTDLHTDEVFFRDTAHGFLTWAVASVVAAAVLGSATASILGGGLQAGAAVGGAGMAAAAAAPAGATPGRAGSDRAESEEANGYFVDALFRKPLPAADAAASASSSSPAMLGSATPDPAQASGQTREAGRILLNAVRQPGALPAEDQRYLAQLVASRTGLSAADADKRVADTYARLQAKLQDAEAAARDAADKARKASAAAALWIVVSLFIGAFVASLAATFGGRQRDV